MAREKLVTSLPVCESHLEAIRVLEGDVCWHVVNHFLLDINFMEAYEVNTSKLVIWCRWNGQLVLPKV